MAEQAGGTDLNFCYPIDVSKLQGQKLRLVPFDSNFDLFARHFVFHTSTPIAIENFRYLPYGPFHTVDSFREWYNEIIKPNNGTVWFAILLTEEAMQESMRQRRQAGLDVQAPHDDLKVNDGTSRSAKDEYFAGSIGLLNAVASGAVCEVGHINILPHFQRTFVTTNAVALLLKYLLGSPLQLRRVTWLANARNERSVKAAERMGFRLEGVMRWHRVLPEGKEGELVEREGIRDGRGPGRDTAMLSICWDDWRDGVRDKVQALVER